MGQQVSIHAAAAIHGRLLAALKGDVSAVRLLRVRETTLRRAGLSKVKDGVTGLEEINRVTIE